MTTDMGTDNDLKKPVALVQLIVTNLEVRGDGTKANPNRCIRQFWTPEGKLVAEVDPLTSRLNDPNGN